MENQEKDRYELVMDMIRFKQYNIAIESLEEIVDREGRPAEALSMLGVALARSGKDMKKAIELCREAINKNKHNASFYFNLADIYRRVSQKGKAIQTIKAGLRALPGNKRLISILNRFGVRKAPVFSFLERSHPINKIAGKFRTGPK
ncbi:MAG: tetratricopeptide repeat protein [Deltaproteobacteria bacterium]|nr:tetratricopeptide repeat protein [Deltaproteobacteria bacterium]